MYVKLMLKMLASSDEISTNIDPNSVPPCTFDQISKFHTTTRSSSNSNNKSLDGEWKLQDEIVRVPASAIVNADNLQALGTCGLGSVYKAVIRIPASSEQIHDERSSNSQYNYYNYCAAVLKTDICYQLSDAPFEIWKYIALTSKERTGQFTCDENGENCVCTRKAAHSCLSTTQYGWNLFSFLGGEYTGALPWYAQLQTNEFQKGLLPTWAIVHAPDRPLRQIFPLFLQRIVRKIAKQDFNPLPLTDRTVVGILMPLIKFKPFDSLTEEERNMSATDIARLMITASEGLAFLHRMGLAFQDIIHRNIGIVYPPKREGAHKLNNETSSSSSSSSSHPYSIIFDNSLLALQHNFTCDAKNDTVCHFDRRENVFNIAKKKDNFLTIKNGALASDMRLFRNVIYKELIQHSTDPKAKELYQAMKKGQTMDEIVQILHRFVSAQA
jgi:hypothetical protein